MKLRIGVLIIGSLYWDTDRQSWRNARLRMEEDYTVRTPIRYGRRSPSRGNTYTMVFSPQCETGQAKVVRCKRDVSTANDLFIEAEHLWAVERKGELNGLVSAKWGCVAFLRHPDRYVPRELLDAWAVRVTGERHYGNIPQAAGEGPLVNEHGLLQIPWPTLIAGDGCGAAGFADCYSESS